MQKKSLPGVIAALAATMAGLFLVLAANPAAAAPDFNWRHWVGAASGRCLDVDTNSNVTVQLWSCDSGSDESWAVKYAGTAYGGVDFYRIYNRRTGDCLTTPYNSTANGMAVIAGDCATSLTQWWYFPVKTGPVQTIVNLESGLCLDARNNATGNGTIVQQWTCNGTTAQSWIDSPV